MIALTEVESALALFAEGIAGRYYHIKPVTELRSRHIAPEAADTLIAGNALYLPEHLDSPDGSGYRVLVMLQLGAREFGTYRFAMATARTRIPALTDLAVPEARARESDFSCFFRHFTHPGLLKRVFSACEQVRVVARLLERYPGLGRHLDRYRDRRHGQMSRFEIDDLTGLVTALELAAEGVPRQRLDDATGALEPVLDALAHLRSSAADVYDSAALALTACLAWQEFLPGTLAADLDPDQAVEDGLEWMQREERLEEWEDALEALEDRLNVSLPEGSELDAVQGDAVDESSERDPGVDIRSLGEERDNLKRRLDMEKSSVVDALGADPEGTRSYRYDEWDHLERRYRRHWCRLFEERLDPDPDADLGTLRQVIDLHTAAVMRQLEQIRPLGYQRVRRLADGDELDFNALLEARQDVLAGISPDERVYSRRERVHRDVCAAFLVDLSASTDDPVVPPVPAEPVPDDVSVNLRDPYDDVLALAAEAETEAPRRIIDVQRESMLVMSAALERLGDSYGIYGFSGYGRECVEFVVAKEPREPFTARTLASIAGMKPRRSTRMGPAIRHAVGKLVNSGNALKLLIVVSDGFPQDADYGPLRGDHEYGLQDTARALEEARAKGVEVFCVTVDKSGNDYLRRMCPRERYLVIDEIEDLPEKLSAVYRSLSGR